MEESVLGSARETRPLPPELVGVLQDLAQGLLNQEHALGFYPEGHQARQAPLERLVALLRAEAGLTGEASLAFSEDHLQWRGAQYDELPPAARKLSSLLGNQGIARISWSQGLTAAELERFLTLLARGRGAGHRLAWDSAARFENLRVEALDYQALMTQSAEDETGLSSERRDLWHALLQRALASPQVDPSVEELKLLRERWADPAALASLLTEAIGAGALEGDSETVDQVRRFTSLVERAAAVGEPLPEGECAQKLGAVALRLPAALRLRLLEATLDRPEDGLFREAFGSLDADEGVSLMVATFAMDPVQIGRLSRVFQHIIPRQLERMELVPRLREGIRGAGDPNEPLADNAWNEVQELLTGESGEFMSPGYQEQLRRLETREQARRDGELSLAALPELAVDLAATHVAEESLLIQFEQLHLATSVERYRDTLEGIGGLCGAALAAGDRERGLLILRRLMQVSAGGEPLAGPRTEIERTLRAIASPQVLQALIPLLGNLAADDLAALGAFAALVPASAAPIVLDALADEEDSGRRRDLTALLQVLGTAALPEMLRRLALASPAMVRTLLPLVSELRAPAAAPALLGLLGRDDDKVRREALRALVDIDSPEVRRALPGLLEDRDTEIVQVAAAHLGALGSPETVQALLKELETGVFRGRRSDETQRAIFVLGRMRAAAAVAPLAALLLRRSWINRRVQEKLKESAAQALARIGGDGAKKALEEAAARGTDGLAATCRRLLTRWDAP